MRAKTAAIVYALLALGLSWLWFSRGTSHDLPEAEYARGEGGQRSEQRADSKRDLWSGRSFPPNPSRARVAPESGALGPAAARSGSTWRRVRVSHEGRARAVDAGTRGGDDEGARRQRDFDRFKRLVDGLHDTSRETPGGRPIEPDEAGLKPEDVARLDLDGDRVISPWELDLARRRLGRAESHPADSDLGDAEYPVGREEYARSEEEFAAVDANRDGVFDIGEYLDFLLLVDRITFSLDVDRDRKISRNESRLSDEDFAPLDVDDSGYLRRWEIRRAIALDALD
jgi:hypothetical protein